MSGLVPTQEIVEVRLADIVFESPKAAIDRVLSERPPHRILSMSMTSAAEFNTAALVLLVIEYVDEG